VTYAGEFDVDFSMNLTERRSPTLLLMQEDAIYIEGNMIASGKMKKIKYWEENKKFKEYCGTFDPSREPQEENMDEMSRLIRNLTKKMSRFEIENNNANRASQEGGIRNPNPNQFKIPRNPQLMIRERRNEEQPIQPPVKTNNDNNFIE
jgi:hypothetical protein